MNIIEYLKSEFSDSIFYNEDTCPDNISFLYVEYRHALELIQTESNVPELILFSDPTFEIYSRYIIFNSKTYILISLTQVSLISQFLELFFFDEIDDSSQISFFFNNYLILNESIDMIFDADLINKNNPLDTRKVRYKHSILPMSNKKTKEYKNKIGTERLTTILDRIEGFNNIFEYYVIYLFTHEFTHCFRTKDDVNRIDSYLNISHKIPNSTNYILLSNSINTISIDESLEEELYCDLMGAELAIKYYFSNDADDDFFLLLFSSIFYSSLLLGKVNVSNQKIDEVFFRKYAQQTLINDFFYRYNICNGKINRYLKLEEIMQFIDFINVRCLTILQSTTSNKFFNIYEYGLYEMKYPELKPLNNLQVLEYSKNKLTELLNKIIY